MGAARCLSCIFVSQNARAAPCRLVTRRRGVPPRSAPRSRRAFLPDGRLRHRAALRSRGRARRGSRSRNSFRLSRSARVSLRGRLDRAVLLLRRRSVLAHAVGARVLFPHPRPPRACSRALPRPSSRPRAATRCPLAAEEEAAQYGAPRHAIHYEYTRHAPVHTTRLRFTNTNTINAISTWTGNTSMPVCRDLCAIGRNPLSAAVHVRCCGWRADPRASCDVCPRD